ncbi:hypothetical protein C8R46DRAFT_1328303 [Mycena filopes]|nr:hypothetical protein C8R46DRAFT_1328303 [Mycena filopes]
MLTSYAGAEAGHNLRRMFDVWTGLIQDPEASASACAVLSTDFLAIDPKMASPSIPGKIIVATGPPSPRERRETRSRSSYSARHDIAVPLLAVNPSKLSNLYYISNNVTLLSRVVSADHHGRAGFESKVALVQEGYPCLRKRNGGDFIFKILEKKLYRGKK